ncbi:MAG: type IV-A pilus assembly ATPase PilB [Candidatus Abyssobacteria bacterium SURF_17]|uniref:protein-secreting ATPase n=1 Tax=Candidatus Abyssobacteria bacterium SURF_17 TaxID=2093361 RepID=A0A419F8J4_9BACT|nr:MAG: type IV-A pilus assembly ATPase PilB [Candidatus Abyssubacteria bacterium SURF_17]
MVEALKKRLGDILIEERLLTPEQLSQALHEQRRTGQLLVAILINSGLVSEEDIVITLSEQLGIPHLRVESYEIPSDVLAEVPEGIARRYHLIPVAKTGKSLTIAMSDPLNIVAIDDVRMLTGHEVETVVSLDSEVKKAIEHYYGGKDTGTDAYEDILRDAQADVVTVLDNKEQIDISNLKKEVEEAPVIRLVNLILVNAIKKNASDIHIEPFEKEVRTRYRVDGVLREVQSPPKSLQAAVVSRIKVLSEMDIAERRIPQDGRFRIKFEGREIDFRVSTLPTYFGEKVVIRILDKGVLQLELDKLGFENQPLDDFRDSLSRPNGIILVTGPTGSGKTTTLYSALHMLNTLDVNIVTVEDPVEYELHGINQVQAKPDVGLTFASGLRSILRQDPDIIMVGEIRDEETADIAIKAALTGHLVLSTLHTNDAPGAVTRLIDMGMEPFLIASSLLMAAAQRLVRKICPDCKQPYRVPDQVLSRAQFRNSPGEKVTLWKGQGCARCGETGYRGRLALLEVLRVRDNIQDLIMAQAPSGEIKRTAIANGMFTLRQVALVKVKAGLTTLEEGLRVTAPD